jgi:hypothetical protein
MSASMDWKHGYFADNGYTFGYYREMAPCYLAWAALLQGVVAPPGIFAMSISVAGRAWG